VSDDSRQREDLLMDQIDLKNRIIERLVKQLDHAKDVSESLMMELDAAKAKLAASNATVDRLRLHIQQGIEL
jgi:hypothetical protein